MMTEVKPTPLYILGVIPDKNLNIKGFFEYGEESFRWMLEHPKSLRSYGWDLETLDRAKIVEGKWIEVRNGERKKIQLVKDGALLMAAYADNTFLGWGKSEEEFAKKPKINTLALIEVTFNFVEFYREFLSKLEEKPQFVEFFWDLRNLFLDSGKKCYLTPYGVDSAEYTGDWDMKEAPGNNKDWSYKLEINKVNIYDSEKVSYKLLEEIFLWFGFEPSKIPYIVGEGGNRRLNTEQIKKIGKE